MTCVLIIEDEPTLRRNLQRGLVEEGYQVIAAASIREVRSALGHDPDLVLLDLGLPDGNGLDWLREFRTQNNRQPVLIVTARDSIADRVLGLDAGGDDYLVKPFSFNELLARLRALGRRSLSAVAVLTVEDLEVDRLRRVARRGGRELDLTHRQFELLAYLMEHAHVPVSRDMIARDVWRETTATWTNLIAVQIAQLRRKIESPGSPTILHTVRGQGYQVGQSLGDDAGPPGQLRSDSTLG
jgi:DNA-binding response OmpR family regulator